MNMFEISYDVSGATLEHREAALRTLVSMLVHRLECPLVKRYVASSLIFTTARNYFDVVAATNEWSNANRTFFIIAQIVPHEDGHRYYYTMTANMALQREIDNLCIRARLHQI